ncbi:MAG: UbiA family prenyltransferase [Pseudomonadota bacterium]
MIQDLASLLRARLGLLAALGAMAGYVLAAGRADLGLMRTLAGAFLLAGGCSALNQAQERRQDALMARTRNRPLPASSWRLGQVLALALACLALAFWLLGGAAQPLQALLFVLVPIIYNGLYTPLKRLSSFSLLVGGLAGALSPYLGWVAAGGRPGDFRVLLLAVIIYAWQVPHFGLLARRHQQDYQAAGFPVGQTAGRWARPGSPLLAWLMGYCALLLLAPALGLLASAPAKWLLAGLALALAAVGVPALARGRLGAGLVNLSLLLFLLGLTVDALWGGALSP